ncbi:MAG: HAMP domain-containing protein [Deltaproteobacteria bacterium]|nr:HAMP domain-containing protein [Deltaproteobacteria bacterium]
MKIKTRLQIAVILTLIISVTVGLFIFSAYREMNEWGQKEITTGRVSQNMAELKIITHEYLLHPGERSLMQWKASHDSLAKLLAEKANVFEDSGEKDTLKKTLKSLERFSNIFAELVAISGEEHGYGEHRKNGISRLEVKLTGDLLVESQIMVSRVFRMNQVIQANLVSVQRKTGLLIVILFIVFAGLVSSIALWISRSIGAPITRLEEGIRIVGAGNLDHRVGTDAKDEIGHLSRAFDNMTQNLKKSTASIDDLNREIDARKKTEAALRESEVRFRELFENMRSGVAVYEAVDNGEDFIFKDFNKGAENIDGISRESVVGKRITEAFPRVKGFGIFEVFQRVWQTGKPEHFSDAMYSDERITGWRENYVYRLPSSEVVAIYDDITDRKQAEEEIKAHREHLALINQILRHDITNDLVVIQSAINLYNNSPEEELLKEIFSRTGKSIDLINRMRELETFISRHRELNIYEMRDIIDEVIKNYPSIDFEIEGEARVMADDSLSSVIDNIVRNAVIHGKADKITITTGRERDMCEVRIADNGTGIPNEIKEKVFEEGFMHGGIQAIPASVSTSSKRPWRAMAVIPGWKTTSRREPLLS